MTCLTEAKRFLSITVSKTRYAAREQRGLEFNIDIDYIMNLLEKQNGKCALTGWDMEFTRSGVKGDGNPYGCTMDRINSDLGYIKGNIQLACWWPNKVKSNMSNREFIRMCKDVAKTC
jgi:hypothetical protein